MQRSVKNLQIPSFTIIRNTIIGLIVMVVTYLLNESIDGNLIFAMDEYENAYSPVNMFLGNGYPERCKGRRKLFC